MALLTPLAGVSSSDGLDHQGSMHSVWSDEGGGAGNGGGYGGGQHV